MALKRKETASLPLSLPSPPPNSEVLINDELTCDEVRVKIDVYGAKLSIEASSISHMKYAARCLGKIIEVNDERNS